VPRSACLTYFQPPGASGSLPGLKLKKTRKTRKTKVESLGATRFWHLLEKKEEQTELYISEYGCMYVNA
jgi:hypothetical protein